MAESPTKRRAWGPTLGAVNKTRSIFTLQSPNACSFGVAASPRASLGSTAVSHMAAPAQTSSVSGRTGCARRLKVSSCDEPACWHESARHLRFLRGRIALAMARSAEPRHGARRKMCSRFTERGKTARIFDAQETPGCSSGTTLLAALAWTKLVSERISSVPCTSIRRRKDRASR